MILEIVASNTRQKTNEKRENTEIWNNRTNPDRHSIKYRTRNCERKKRACGRQCLFPLATMKDASNKDHFAFRLAVCARFNYFYRGGVPGSPYAPRHLHTISHRLDRRDRWAHGWTAAHGRLFKIGTGVSLALNMIWKEEICMPNHHRLAGHLEVGHGKHLFPQAEGHFSKWPCVCLLAVLLSQPLLDCRPRICRRIFRMLKFVNLLTHLRGRGKKKWKKNFSSIFSPFPYYCYHIQKTEFTNLLARTKKWLL